MAPVTVQEIVDFLGDSCLEVQLGSNLAIDGVAPVLPGETGAISFWSVSSGIAIEKVRSSASSVLIVDVPHEGNFEEFKQSVVVVSQPRLAYMQVLAHFFAPPRPIGIHPSAVVESQHIGEDAYIAPGAYVGPEVSLGDRCTLGANVVLIGKVTIGSDVTIGPNTTIGFTGFGYGRESDGTPVPFPHFGGVTIGNGVEIGANTAIDRGTLRDTVIHDNAKIDNLVHVAHNVTIHENAFVIATTILCGGVTVGKNAWVAPNASVLEQVTIGEGATVGLSATVLKDVPDGATVVGSPARILEK